MDGEENSRPEATDAGAAGEGGAGTQPIADGACSVREPAEAATGTSPAVAIEASQTAETVEAEPALTPEEGETDAEVLRASKRQTRRAFFWGGVAAAAGVGFYEWLDLGKEVDMQPALLRRAFETNAAISRDTFRDRALSPTYPLSRAETLRVNGVFGLKRELEPESWRLQVAGVRNARQHPRFTPDVTAWTYRYAAKKGTEDQGHDTKVDPRISSAAKMAPMSMQDKAAEDENHTGRKPRGMEEAGESESTLPPHTPGLLLTIEDVLRLPRHEFVTQFKCIEGWSQIVRWAGVRMADFIEAYPPAEVNGREPRYVSMETPDGDYYTGYDLDDLRHPQALLVTEMMGAPLTQYHGAPLRLHLPTKYGYKQIKRIALISYTDDKPDDYWTKLGYDWYAGL